MPVRTTPLIQVGHFVNGEVYNITSIPQMTFPLATNNIVLDRPIIGWDEVKSLTLDGTRATFKGDYAAVWKFYLGEPPKRSLSRSQEFLND